VKFLKIYLTKSYWRYKLQLYDIWNKRLLHSNSTHPLLTRCGGLGCDPRESSLCTPLRDEMAWTRRCSSGLLAAFFNSLLIIFSVFSRATASTSFCDRTDNFARADASSSVARAWRARSWKQTTSAFYFITIINGKILY
jgi:hypothetical protein